MIADDFTDDYYAEARCKAELAFLCAVGKWRGLVVESLRQLHGEPLDSESSGTQRKSPAMRRVLLRMAEVLTPSDSPGLDAAAARAAKEAAAKNVKKEAQNAAASRLVVHLEEICEEYMKAELRAYAGAVARAGRSRSQVLARVEQRAEFTLEETHRRKWILYIPDLECFGEMGTNYSDWACERWEDVKNSMAGFVELELGFDLWPEKVPPGEATPHAVPNTRTRKERIDAFCEAEQVHLAAIEDSADVATSDRIKWERGQIPDSSVMSQRIERVLSGERPLLTKDQREAHDREKRRRRRRS